MQQAIFSHFPLLKINSCFHRPRSAVWKVDLFTSGKSNSQTFLIPNILTVLSPPLSCQQATNTATLNYSVWQAPYWSTASPQLVLDCTSECMASWSCCRASVEITYPQGGAGHNGASNAAMAAKNGSFTFTQCSYYRIFIKPHYPKKRFRHLLYYWSTASVSEKDLFDWKEKEF